MYGPSRNKVDYFGAHKCPVANHDGGRQVSAMVKRHAGSERYTAAGGQIEVPSEGDGRVTQAIVVYRYCCRVRARAEACLDRWGISNFNGLTFF